MGECFVPGMGGGQKTLVAEKTFAGEIFSQNSEMFSFSPGGGYDMLIFEAENFSVKNNATDASSIGINTNLYASLIAAYLPGGKSFEFESERRTFLPSSKRYAMPAAGAAPSNEQGFAFTNARIFHWGSYPATYSGTIRIIGIKF